MIKLISVCFTFILSFSTLASINLKCHPVFGQSVYSQLQVNLKIQPLGGLPYSLEEYLGAEVLLSGEKNENHPDVLENDFGWSYVTLGERKSFLKRDEMGVYFYIETCLKCDFNSARYQYRLTSEGEIFLTELYGSDHSGEFSLYSCVAKNK